MKIAFIVGSFPKLSETFILNQITGLIDKGHSVDIFAETKSNEKLMHSEVAQYNLLERASFVNIPSNKFYRKIKALYLAIINLYRAPIKILRALNIIKYKDLGIFYRMLPLVNKKFDIVHCHFGPKGNTGIILKDLGVLNGKILTSFYGYDISSYINKDENIYCKLFDKVDLMTVLSKDMKKKLINLGAPKNKILIHHLGIKPNRFKYKRKTFRKNTVKFLTVARLVEKKGLKYAVEAFSKVVNSIGSKKIQYDIVGDGPLKKELEEMVFHYKLQNSIKLWGWKNREEIIGMLNKAHIFILPSVTAKNGDQEGTPTVLLEAMAEGLPVISTYHSGIPEQVKNGKTGFLVPEKDTKSLTKKIKYLIEHPETWSGMGRKGRELVEKEFNINKLNDKLIEIYKNLVDK